MQIDYPVGATPLDPNEMQGLIPVHLVTKAELDRWEQENINDALAWIEKKKPADILNESFIRTLHKQMFCNTWKWTGTFRTSDKNIGVSWHQIPIQLKQLCDNATYWMEQNTFGNNEIAVRFHHKLVYIHIFPNGNGRHARFMADIMMEYVFHEDPFTWGKANLIKSGTDRKRYIDSLKAADQGDYSLLMDFAHS